MNFVQTLQNFVIHIGLGCTHGIPTYKQVKKLAESCTGPSCEVIDTGTDEEGLNLVIPGMRFTCSGTVIGWRVAGEIQDGRNRSRDAYPRLQIWRQEESSTDYYTSDELEIQLLNRNRRRVSNSNNVYDCDLSGSERVEVQPGDILGVYLSRTHMNFGRFAVYLDTSSTSPPLPTTFSAIDIQTSYPFGDVDVQQANRLPLVSLRVEQNGKAYYNYTHT